MTTIEEGKKDMNDAVYTYEEEARLSADRDMFDECRFTSGEEDRIYEAESERYVSGNQTIS